jgi:alpha-D-xyloside xylohydrolase
MDAPLDTIPLLVKAGSIVPVGLIEQYAGEDRSGNLELRVYPGANGDFTLYGDDGVSYAYEKGAQSTIPFHWDNRLKVLTVGAQVGSYAGMAKSRSFTIHMAGTDRQSDKHVIYSGQRLTIRLN